MGRRVATLLALALLAAPAPAHAFESIFMDDDLLLHRGEETARATLRELRDLGVDRVRITVNWAAAAPGLGAAPIEGSLTAHDALLRMAEAEGIRVLVTVSGGSRPVRPSRGRFGLFVEALGRRWDGRDGRPRVSAWSLWNEPNWGGLLQPQTTRDSAGRWVPRAARRYRALHRAGAAALARTGHGQDVLLLGETAPRGAKLPGPGRATAPVDFLADLLCLHRRTLRPLRGRAALEQGCSDFARAGALPATGYAHHPYNVLDPPDRPAPSPRDAGLADARRLTRVLDAAARAGRVRRGLRLWYTENGWQTEPDPFRGVPLGTHVRWLGWAERLARADRRVIAHTQFLLRDTPPDDRWAPSDPRFWGTYQSGLRFDDGRPKPALRAYPLPVAVPARAAADRPMRLWGLLRPPADARGERVVVEFRPDGVDAFSPVAEVTVQRPGGAFATDVPPPPATGQFRLVWPRPDGSSLAGQPVRVAVG